MRPILRVLRTRLRSRDGALLLDTGLTAAMGVLLVVLAARGLTGSELDRFSTAQLVVVALVGILRSSVYGPAMQVQKSTGRAVLPGSWLMLVSAPVAILGGAIFALVIDGGGGQRNEWVVCLVCTMLAVLLQDAARSVLLSREAVAWAIASDAVGLVALLAEAVVGLLGRSDLRQLYCWALAAFLALAVSLVALVLTRDRTRGLPRQSLRATWTLGKWSCLDATLSSAGSLLPFFVAALVVGGGAAGIYRTLQTALGPLNIIHTTAMTSFALDAWQAASPEGLTVLRKRATRLTLGMSGLGLVYVACGIPLMIWVANLHGQNLVRVSIVVALGALMGAVNTAANAGSLVLGYQWAGAVIRGIIVALSVLMSIPWSVHHWVPWHDAIGSTWLMSNFVALAGWTWAYRSAVNHELERHRHETQQPDEQRGDPA